MTQTPIATTEQIIFRHLETATVEILRHAFELAQYREHSPLAEYRDLIRKYGWNKGGAEEKRSLKIAAAYAEFVQCPEALEQIEPKTLYLLAERKEYRPVIAQLQELEEISQAVVLGLMKECRLARIAKLAEKPSIWRQTKGGRYCKLPPIHEEDEATGIKIQKWMDSGHTAQYIIREAITTLSLLPEWQTEETEFSIAPEDETQAAIEFVAAQKQKQLDEVNKLLLPVPSPDAANEVSQIEHLAIQENLVAITNTTAATTIDKVEISCVGKQLSLLAENTNAEEAGTLASWVIVNPPSSRPMNKQEQSFDEMGMLADEEFGDGATEPNVALINSQNYLNLMHGRIEEIKAQIEKCEKKHLLKNLQNDLKDWLHRSSKEIWQAYQFAAAAGIKLTILANANSSQFVYNFEIPQSVVSDEFLVDYNELGESDNEKIIEALRQSQVYSEIISITEHFSEEFKKTIWALIDECEKERILALKEQHFQELANVIQVGDRVTWNNAPAHFSHWMPLVVTDVKGDKATFDMYSTPVPIAELTKI